MVSKSDEKVPHRLIFYLKRRYENYIKSIKSNGKTNVEMELIGKTPASVLSLIFHFFELSDPYISVHMLSTTFGEIKGRIVGKNHDVYFDLIETEGTKLKIIEKYSPRGVRLDEDGEDVPIL